MNKLYLVCFTIVVLLFATALFASLFLIRNRLDQENYGSHFIELKKIQKFSFTPKHDNINILVFTMKNPGLKSQDEFIIRIFKQDKLLRIMNFSGFNVGDPGDLKFQFEPISESLGRNLDIEILRENSNSPVFINADREEQPAFRAYYRNIDKKKALVDLFTEWKNNISENFPFFVVWTGVLIGILWWGGKYEKA